MEPPPRLEDFGLSAVEYDRVPRLLRDRVSERLHTRVAVALGAVIGLWTWWGVFMKTTTAVNGIFFGVLIGFVAFLLASFLGSMVIRFAIHGVSTLQRRIVGGRDQTARRAYGYDDALRGYRKAHAGDPGLGEPRPGMED